VYFLKIVSVRETGKLFIDLLPLLGTVEAKAIPQLSWTGPEGSRRMRLPVSKTIGQWRW